MTAGVGGDTDWVGMLLDDAQGGAIAKPATVRSLSSFIPSPLPHPTAMYFHPF